MAATEAVTEGIGLLMRDLVAYLYSNNGIVASNQPERLKRTLDVLTGLLERAGLRINTQKMAIMDCQPCHAHARLTTGTDPAF